jgi:hypothetical protein
VAAQSSRSSLRRAREATPGATGFVISGALIKRTFSVQGATLLGDELPTILVGQAAGAHGAVRLGAAAAAAAAAVRNIGVSS